jgi:magnesium-transporting ATPase (P-type)
VLEASLTGESEAVLKDAAPLAASAALGDRLNLVFKGAAVAQGTGRANVTATGMRTEMGGIATLLDTTPDTSTPLQGEIAFLGKVLGIGAVVIAAAVAATIPLISDIHGVANVLTVLLLGVSLAVAAVPERLPAVGRCRPVGRLAGRGRALALPQPRLRHRPLVRRTVVRVPGDGQWGAVGQ